jgi:hypothetical protein
MCWQNMSDESVLYDGGLSFTSPLPSSLSLMAMSHIIPPNPGPLLFCTGLSYSLPWPKRAVVSDIFAYVACRVMMRWEWEEAHMSRPSFVQNLGNTLWFPCPCLTVTSVNLQETFLDLYKLVQAKKVWKAPKVQKQPRFRP